MIVVRGKAAAEMTGDELAQRAAGLVGVTVDLGAGDGRYAYAQAREHPGRLFIAIDPVRENMREISAKAAKKPDRGGLPNVLYVVASIEQLPPELAGSADQVVITLPWGSLMRGIMLGDPGVLAAIASLGRPGAGLRIVLNTRIFDDPVPLDARDLPEMTPAYVLQDLLPAFADARLRIDEARWMEPEEVAALGTTWAKRLSHRSPPRSVLLTATINPNQGPAT